MPKKKSNIVKRTLDLRNPPELSAEQQARLEAVALMADKNIDYSDAPYLPDAVWMKAVNQLLIPESKSQFALMPKYWRFLRAQVSGISRV